MDRLDLIGLSKGYPGVTALDNVSFSAQRGEVRALMGENGAGKSTLLSILGGATRPDTGEIRIDGTARRLTTPRDARAAGIAIIHQELQLASNLSVAENLFLGQLPNKRGLFDQRALGKAARTVLDRLKLSIDPASPVSDLAIGKRQMIEIGRALVRNASVIAFDEPTSSLSQYEVATLFEIIADLRRDGCTILYVTHRMDELAQIADSVTVLRDGRHVCDFDKVADLQRGTLVAAMAGRDVADIRPAIRKRSEIVAIKAVDLKGPGLRGPISFDAHRGEIVGFFGLVGAGRTELFRLLYGVEIATDGKVIVNDQPCKFEGPKDAIAAGLALCPEDRKDEGIIPGAAVSENAAIAARNKRNGGHLLIHAAKEQADCAQLLEAMQVHARTQHVAIQTLSGGNQQKVILARWMATNPSILLLDEPTRGIDVAARSEIYRQLDTFVDGGGTILFSSSDAAELLTVADRIIVMNDGRIAGTLTREQATTAQLLELAFPGSKGFE